MITFFCCPFSKVFSVYHLRNKITLKDISFYELACAFIAVVLEFPAELVSNKLCSFKDASKTLIFEEVNKLVVTNKLFFLRSALL